VSNNKEEGEIKMLKNKRFLLTILVALLLLLIPSMVNAADEETGSSIINGITVNWTYELDESNQIKNLKCTNVGELTGSFSIPSTIDEKNVVSIGRGAFENATGITGIVVPDTVKKIENNAFENCTSLSSVDLGSIESISFDVFKGCTALKEITIPKTLKNTGVSPVFTNCTNLTKITLEDGLTIIPANLCATTGITEIVVPSTVKEIGSGAFENCTSLNKITILDGVTDMGWYTLYQDTDTVFQNHNENLTIYCYEDSFAAEYAINTKIKYVYMERPSTPTEPEKEPTPQPEEKPTPQPEEQKDTIKNEDETKAEGSLPNTGGTFVIIISILGIILLGVYAYKRNKDLKGI